MFRITTVVIEWGGPMVRGVAPPRCTHPAKRPPCASQPRVQGLGSRVQGLGFRVQGAECRVQGAGCRVQGVGVRSGLGEAGHARARQEPVFIVTPAIISLVKQVVLVHIIK